MISHDLNIRQLRQGAVDFRHLLNRGYPRKAALTLVGNRYQLTFDERHLLHRGVFCEADSKRRRRRKILAREVHGRDLAIDGHNVLITIEAGLSGQPLILGDDGFVRDISQRSGSFEKTEATEKAFRHILNFLKKVKPRHVMFLLDAPISRSGLLAQELRNLLAQEQLPGDAQAVAVPETILIGFPGVVATSDTAILDHSKRVMDLAGFIIQRYIKPPSLIYLSSSRGPLSPRTKRTDSGSKARGSR